MRSARARLPWASTPATPPSPPVPVDHVVPAIVAKAVAQPRAVADARPRPGASTSVASGAPTCSAGSCAAAAAGAPYVAPHDGPRHRKGGPATRAACASGCAVPSDSLVDGPHPSGRRRSRPFLGRPARVETGVSERVAREDAQAVEAQPLLLVAECSLCLCRSPGSSYQSSPESFDHPGQPVGDCMRARSVSLLESSSLDRCTTCEP